MEQALKILREQLTKARIEYERAEAACKHTYAGHAQFTERQFRYGIWNGVAKSIEALMSHNG